MLQPVLTTISPIYPIILLSLILSCYTQRHRTIVDDVQQYEYSESTRSNAILELMETPNSPSACNGPYEEIRFPEQMCFPLYDGTKKCFQIRLPGSGCQCVSGAERNQETGQCEMKTECTKENEERVNIAGCLPSSESDDYPSICLPPEMRCLCKKGFVRDLVTNNCVQLNSPASNLEPK